MAAPKVLAVWTVRDGVQGDIDVTSTLSATQDVVFRVRYDQVHNDPTIVYGADATALTPPAATGYNKKIPPIGSARGSYIHLHPQAKRLAEDPRVWEVTCSYKVPVPGQQSKPADPEVTRWAISVAINPIPFDYENQKDAFGKLIVNKVGDAISGVMTQRKMEEIVITFSCVEVDWIGLDAVYGVRGDGCVNSEDVTLVINGQARVFPAGTLHWEDYALQYTLDSSGFTYPQMIYRLRWRNDGWQRFIANKGFNQLVGGVKLPIFVGGSKISSPVYLKTSGSNQVPASPGDSVEDITGTPPTPPPGTTLYDTFDIGAEILFDLNT